MEFAFFFTLKCLARLRNSRCCEHTAVSSSEWERPSW